MKGLSIKKLAAIAAGAALVGTAVAPVAMALQGGPLVKSDLYNDNGTPKASVILGSGAQPTDGIWGGNIAAAKLRPPRLIRGKREWGRCWRFAQSLVIAI